MARGARPGRPKFARVRREIEKHERNPRVRAVSIGQWRQHRYRLFRRSINFAAAAKAYRTAKQVACWEVGKFFGVEATTVSGWESGKYLSWDDAELKEYQKVIDQIAGG